MGMTEEPGDTVAASESLKMLPLEAAFKRY